VVDDQLVVEAGVVEDFEDGACGAGFNTSLVFGRNVGQWSFNSTQGNWNQNNNWSSGLFPDSPTANADFLGTLTSPSSHILLNGNRSAGTLTFDNTNSYLIDGPTPASSLTLGSDLVPAAINVLRGNHSITAKTIVGGDLVITTAAGTRCRYRDRGAASHAHRLGAAARCAGLAVSARPAMGAPTPSAPPRSSPAALRSGRHRSCGLAYSWSVLLGGHGNYHLVPCL